MNLGSMILCMLSVRDKRRNSCKVCGEPVTRREQNRRSRTLIYNKQKAPWLQPGVLERIIFY